MFTRKGHKPLIITFLFIFIPLAGLASIATTHFQKKRISETVADEQRSVLTTIINQRSSSLQTFVDDYGYWDDMVRFLEKPETRWAATTIEPCLEKFEADIVWLYTMNGSLAYSVRGGALANDAVFPVADNADLYDIFKTSRFCHYFVRTNRGYLEICGATVHPTLDRDRKTDPKGYILAGRLWTGEYIAGLSKLWKNRVDVLPKPIDTPERLEIDKGIITFTCTLRDAMGKPAAQIITSSESPVLYQMAHFADLQLVLNAVFLLSSLGMTVILLLKMTEHPSPETSSTAGTPFDHHLHEHDEGSELPVGGAANEISSEFLSLHSRVVKRADFQSLNAKTLRMERFELENRIKQRMSELIQSYEQKTENTPHDSDDNMYGGAERRAHQRAENAAGPIGTANDSSLLLIEQTPAAEPARGVIDEKTEQSTKTGSSMDCISTTDPLAL